MNEQKIKCNVENCKFNDSYNNLCNLNEIKVSCSCRGCNCHDVKETVCSSFKESEE